MAGLLLLMPILPDKVEAWRRLCQEMAGTRREQYEASRRRLGIARERLRLLRVSGLDVAIISIDAAHPEQVLSDLACSTAPFDLWFKRQVLDVHGLDLSEAISRPHEELLIDWQASNEEHS